MSIILYERCFIKANDKYVAMALYQTNEKSSKRWGILAPFLTIGANKSDFMEKIEEFCLDKEGIFLKKASGSKIYYGEQAYSWYLRGITNAKPIESYLDKDVEIQAYCVLKDSKGYHKTKKFSTTEELEKILDKHKNNIVSIGLTKESIGVAVTTPKSFVVSNGTCFLRYNDCGDIETTLELENATIFNSKSACGNIVSKIGNSSFRAIPYKTAKTYQAKRYVIAAIVDGKVNRFVKGIGKLSCEFCDSADEARRFYKKQGEEQLEKFIQKYPEDLHLKYQLADINNIKKENRNEVVH